jgi:hypothetical protein
LRNSLIRSVRRLTAGWYWPLVLLALPNCSFQGGAIGPNPNFNPGSAPRTTLVQCDIERVLQRHCATDDDKLNGIRLAEAAIALNEGRPSAIGLDESPEALARCGGEPEAVPFVGPFPAGQATCLHGTLLGEGATYATPTDVCVALCEDQFGHDEPVYGSFFPDNPPGPGVAEFCTAHARASTNVPGDPNPGLAGGCTFEGSESPGFDTETFLDPRRNPEPVVWGDLVGVSAAGSSLTRTAASTANFDAGAASAQTISRGDAYVEFGGAESNLTHVAGLTAIVGGCPLPGGCPPDTDPSFAGINFAIDLNLDGRYYIIENGVVIPGPDVNTSFGTYTAGDRFRVTLHDHSDGTADVAYSKLIGACTPKTVCAQTVFRTVTGSPARYPLRADTSFREVGATLTNVTLVRIH